MTENIPELLKNDFFASHVGVEIESAADGEAVGRLKIEQKHLNGFGIVHGAAIFALADVTFATAANTREGSAVVTNVSVSFCKAAHKSTTLIAKAREVSLNRKLATYLVEITDDQGTLIAVCQGTVYRKE